MARWTDLITKNGGTFIDQIYQNSIIVNNPDTS